jgi:chromosome segregation protein
MFLKRLTIHGFKSFADRTHIEFSDGITALLGPNGCGKSNVVDAVKWVLGEHAIKSLRAEKMEDVIFGGTEARKQLNVAEVTLSIANETGLLPLDMPEIEIKRRLYRSGESEYFINGAQVRLKDIRELFWDTGVGKTAYSVMEQGKIDQILSSKPEERRYLFEEAAGITRFKERGAEAERNLAKTEENVHQVELILNEVKRLHDSLKIQSEKTLKYRTLRDEIFNYELDIQLLRLKQFKYERDERNETLRRRTEDRNRIRAEMEAENKALEANMDEVNSMEARLVELQKNMYGLALEKNARENEIRLFNEQRGENKVKIGQDEEREKQSLQKITELNNDAAGQDAVVSDLRKQCEGIEENIRSFEENIQLAASRINENEKDASKADEEIHSIGKELAAFEKDLAIITDDIVAELDAGLKKAGYSAVERKNAEEALLEAFGRLRTILSGREALIHDLASVAASGGNIDAAELERITRMLAEGLAEAAAGAEKAEALFQTYREYSPSFIDEFLAPQGIITRKRALDTNIRNVKDSIEERRQRIKNLQNENVNLMAKIDEYRATLENMKVNRAHMNARAQSAEEQARLIRRELSGQEALLKNIRDELALYRKRLEEIDGRINAIHEEIAGIEEKTSAFTAELGKLEKDIRNRNDNVAGKKAVINKRMAELSKVQEALEKIHLELVQSETEIKNIQENFRETHSRDLMEFEERIFSITTSPAELREKLTSARSQMKDLGSVNLMAPEEFTEAKQRYDFLTNQMADLEKARKDLENLTLEIRQESSALFLETYNRIKKNFHNMFRRLFGGGRAELRLSDPNHVLESGIEIFAQPPGKKLEHLSLLSGGECSMTAVALLFATYMVKPSPFCLLDEIDAALDEQNVGRFVHLLREFSDSSQFIIITHNKKTVTGARTLLGVTMEESGVTKLIAVRLENEELAIEEGESLSQHELWDSDGSFEEEDVPAEAGRELPIGINDPRKVTKEQLRPIRSKTKTTTT